MTVLYGIKNCDTVKKARCWLDEHGVAYRFHDFRSDGIDAKWLKHWVEQLGWESVLNRRGTTWRALSEAQRAKIIDNDSAIAAMLVQPALIKRPVLDTGDALHVGFNGADYERLFTKPLQIDRIDHVVLTVRDLAATCKFYSRALGMEVIRFGADRIALAFGQQKINLHLAGHELEPKAAHPKPGSADVCFITATPLAEFIEHFHRQDIPIIEGPVVRTGACGPLLSIYIRDPDLNLLEIANER